MNEISMNTVLRANEMSILRVKGWSTPVVSKDAITVKVRFMGKEYSQRITMDEISVAYGRALQANTGEKRCNDVEVD